MVDGVGGLTPGATPGIDASTGASGAARGSQSGAAFGAALARSTGTSDGGTPLTFSGHAVKRLEQRGVQIDDSRMQRLQTAVDQAQAKGSRDSLILLDDLAFVVSVQNHTVVTAVDDASQQQHVFTNIDSVVIAR